MGVLIPPAGVRAGALAKCQTKQSDERNKAGCRQGDETAFDHVHGKPPLPNAQFCDRSPGTVCTLVHTGTDLSTVSLEP
jgi:hypothetical protein